MINILRKKDGEVSTVLEYLETLDQVGHMWLGASQYRSEIWSVQQVWARVLSLPWLDRQEQGKVWDLRIGKKVQLLVSTSIARV